MPWFPIKHIIKKLRMERGWTRVELAKKSGVKPRTVRLYESDAIPRTGQDDTVRGFAAAFQVPPETVADWLDYDPDVDDLDVAGGAPAKSTLAARAARDDLREWITLRDGQLLELVRPRLLHRIRTAPGLCANAKYAIAGKVRDHRGMPTIVGGVLGLDTAVCGQFLFVRRVHNGDVCYASLFSATADQTARLLDAADAKEVATVVARIEIQKPKDEKFRGFAQFQKRGEKENFAKWCFVIEQVLDGDIPVTYGAPTGSSQDADKTKKASRTKIPRPRSGRSRAANDPISF